MPQDKTWLGTTQAGRMLEVNPKTIVEWVDKGLLPGIRTRTTPTGRLQLNREDLERYADNLNEGK